MSHLDDSVLIVDDEFLIAEGLRMQLEDMGMRVCGKAATADEAVALARLHRPNIVLMDMRLQGPRDGVDAAIEIHAEVGSKVIFVTGSREPSTLERIRQDHPAGVLFKPVSGAQLEAVIQKALRS